jgi:hypothetical protein
MGSKTIPVEPFAGQRRLRTSPRRTQRMQYQQQAHQKNKFIRIDPILISVNHILSQQQLDAKT